MVPTLTAASAGALRLNAPGAAVLPPPSPPYDPPPQLYRTVARAKTEDTGAVAERLLRNQDDIGNAIKPIYGEAAGKQLAFLLRDHILIAADIVTAARSGDNAGVAAGQQRWRKNADDIAVFLSSANPYWPAVEVRNMMYLHLALTTTEVVSRLKKDWAKDIEAYDKGHEHMLMFSDMLADGIVKQFPEKFRE